MSWALLAAAAAGLNAGSGLHAVLMDAQPSPVNEPVLYEANWHVQRTQAASKVNLSSTLALAAALGSIGAYTTAPAHSADPGFITCALVCSTIPIYNALIMSPTASVVSSKVMDTGAISPSERASWLASFQRKSWISTALSLTGFGCTLLMLMSRNGTEKGVRGNLTANPIRF
jgi:hypothetical protein